MPQDAATALNATSSDGDFLTAHDPVYDNVYDTDDNVYDVFDDVHEEMDTDKETPPLPRMGHVLMG